MFIDRLFKPDSSMKRHVAKTITWRIVGTADTMVIAWFISGDPITGVKIGGVEVITKMILYFVHERAWYKVNYGLPQRALRKKDQTEINSESGSKAGKEHTAA